MDPEMTFEQVDADGAIRETAHEAAEALDSGEPPFTAAEVLKAVEGTGFLK
jgi:hypothetical protein